MFISAIFQSLHLHDLLNAPVQDFALSSTQELIARQKTPFSCSFSYKITKFQIWLDIAFSLYVWN